MIDYPGPGASAVRYREWLDSVTLEDISESRMDLLGLMLWRFVIGADDVAQADLRSYFERLIGHSLKELLRGNPVSEGDLRTDLCAMLLCAHKLVEEVGPDTLRKK